MKFDVFRDSDSSEGRVGSDTNCPVPGAVLNKKENRWEIEVGSIEELMEVIKKGGHPAVILPPCDNCEDLAVLNFIDLDEEEMEDEEDCQRAMN